MMRPRRKIIQLCTLIVLSLTSVNALGSAYQEEASGVIMNSLQDQPKHGFLRKLYTQLSFVPAWMHEKGFSRTANELFIYIKDDSTLDKMGKLYQDTLVLERRAEKIYANNGTIAEKIDLEFKISQLYEDYTNYTYFGSINWGAFNARISNLMVNDVNTEWVLHRPDVDALSMLEHATLGGSLTRSFQDALPSNYHYRALQKELARYRVLKEIGGWEPIVLKGVLRKGKGASGVYALRERLRATGDYIFCSDNNESFIYDACLQKAVKSFQSRHGLPVDGEVGLGTLKLLNITVDERIRTVLLNLDRIKWLKNRTQKRRVIVNIPDFMLYFEEDAKLIQTIKTVVGTSQNPTPIFSDMLKTVVLNPYWYLPRSIVQKEMIPELLVDPDAMAKKGIEIRIAWEPKEMKVEADSVDWSRYQYSEEIPFRFAQVPGPKNALGKVKFLFPNKYAVYMHDTPAKALFDKNKRAFSHGCIRLHKPRELLRTLASFNDTIDFEQSQEILKGVDKKILTLREKVPVDIIYLTAWVDYAGKLQFRNDIYGYDAMQLKSFRKW